jgi:squalene-hopene/tetraprenyl-beta-curcumene cyclase
MRPSSLAAAIVILSLSLASAISAAAATNPPANDAKSASVKAAGWDKAAAAKYLDDREVWWQAWPHAQKDHDTVCVSCHTQVPYALARPAMRSQLGEHAVSEPERAMLDSIIKRVNLGNDAVTFYSDAEHGPGKTKEARNAEAVNNTLILAAYDVESSQSAEGKVAYRTQPAIHAASRKAFEAMWATQEQTGAKAGAWLWQNFHFSPWEAPESEYYGAAQAALAVGIAPRNYRADPKIQGNLTLLRDYLRRELPNQPLINRVALLWASSKLSGLMTGQEREALADELKSKQHPDGGWSLTDLGKNKQGESSWKRHDDTPFDLRSDGYATGLIVLALEENGLGNIAEAKKGLAWILANQDKSEGLWPAWSVNRHRELNSDAGKFMSDAATGFSVLALENSGSAK